MCKLLLLKCIKLVKGYPLVFVYELSGCEFESSYFAVRYRSCFEPDVHDIKATIHLKHVREMIKAYSQMHRTDQ